MGGDAAMDSPWYIVRDSFFLSEALADAIVPILAPSGRFVLWAGQDKAQVPEPCTWDDGAPWVVRYALVRGEGGKAFHLRGRFERGPERLDLGEPELTLAPGFLFLKGKISRFTAAGDFRWLDFLR